MFRSDFIRLLAGVPLAAAAPLGANIIFDTDSKLAERMKAMTEDVADMIGAPTNTRYAATGEEVVSYAIAYHDSERGRDDLLGWWKNTVHNVYREATHHCEGTGNLRYPATLYWRQVPEIVPWISPETNVIAYADSDFQVDKMFRARLLISCSGAKA